MAEEPEDRPFAELTEETKRHLEGMESELDEAEKDIEAIAELGVDVSRLKERTAWGRHAVDVIKKRLMAQGKR